MFTEIGCLLNYVLLLNVEITVCVLFWQNTYVNKAKYKLIMRGALNNGAQKNRKWLIGLSTVHKLLLGEARGVPGVVLDGQVRLAASSGLYFVCVSSRIHGLAPYVLVYTVYLMHVLVLYLVF